MLVNSFSRPAARAALSLAGFSFSALLAAPESNPKVAKNGKLGVLSAPLHLAPARLSGFNVCPQASQGCIAACLHTAGNPVYMPAKSKSRIAKTQAYMRQRPAFLALLAFEIAALVRKAEGLGMEPSVRLNATSDIAWEAVALTIDGKAYRNLMEAFPMVQFYDYTKVTKRALKHARGYLPPNYHLTFSKTEANDVDVTTVLNAGGNVAVVFAKGLPTSYMGSPVIDGDETDYRPLDPMGVVVGLKAKGLAKSDASGFVVRNAA
jgi:hypothetical protein